MLAMIPAASLGETMRVKATDGNSWRPAHRFIGRGDTVKWTNPSPRGHNIASMNAATDWSFFKGLPPQRVEVEEVHPPRHLLLPVQAPLHGEQRRLRQDVRHRPR
jgi:plastocyanin